MKRPTVISAKALIIFLRYSLMGVFLWNVFQLLVYLFYQLGPALLFGQRKGITLPIVFKPIDRGILELPHTDYEYIFRIPEATGTFQAFGLPLKLFYLQSVGVLLYYTSVLLIIYYIIKMLGNAQTGTLLVQKNAIRLRHIALLLIVTLLIDRITFIASSIYLQGKVALPGIEFYNLTVYSFEDWKHIFLYLFLLIIAEAFRLGAQLKEENDLTI